ncbi:MAG TPA: DUF6476 family protein [Paracoccaceae bacterium]|nr:DUF6476 family protein [Paracoccaceae bacterium]
MDQTDPLPRDMDAPAEPPRLRLLRRLVTALTAFLILAVITIVALLAIRLLAAPQTVRLALPETILLPAGERAEAATIGRDWVLIVTRDGAGRERVRLFDAATGAPREVVEIGSR